MSRERILGTPDSLADIPEAARPPHAAPRTAATGARAILAASIGNALEWYDFSVYALFAIFIARSVFAGGDAVSALISAFIVFGVGFIARPLGAVLLGAYADRAGRRAALTLTLMIMAAGTLCIAVAPPYAAIGFGAPLLVLCGRLLQGLSAGGEIGGAVAFLVEHAPPERRGRHAAWLQASMAVSNILGATVATTLSLILSPEQLGAWGWRVPFILGFSIAPVGLWLRASLPETPDFEVARHEQARTDQPRNLLGPLAELCATRLRDLIVACGISVVWVIAVYTLVIYLPTYVQRKLGFSPSQAFTASVVGNIAMAIGCILAGQVSDRIGRVRTVRISTVLIVVSTWPVLAWITSARTLTSLFVGQTVFCLVVSAFAGSVPAVMASIFPARLRSTGVAVSYNFIATVFGGFTPAALTFLTERHQVTLAPAFYVIGSALVSLWALSGVREQASS
ncbi:MAG TPA: MFS transporter [Steroidobacteraceae bacterium]|nr:MFS transporter [Steroidobacteraceae bacterium]